MLLVCATELLNRHAYCLYSFSSSGLGVVLILPYRPWKTNLHAITAINAFERVLSLLSVSQTDFSSFGRTHSGTIVTQVTFASIPVNSAPIAREGLPDILKRVTPGSGSGEQVLQDSRKHMHLYYLSEQPMQGSIDRVITGISAISQPGNIASKAGTLAKVGVRIFSLSR